MYDKCNTNKIKPIFAKEGSRTVKYEIIDNYEYVKNIVRRDYETYSGLFLERYFQEKLRLSYEYSAIGNYWERGNQNELDEDM